MSSGWHVPERTIDGHKGTFGTVTVVGGCASGGVLMAGAPALAALGALRSGAGLCRVCAPLEVLGVVQAVVPESTGLVVDGDSVSVEGVGVVGCGLGGDAAGLVRGVLESGDGPLVVDADGLNAAARDASVMRALIGACSRRDVVLTPHPGEFGRLAAGLGVSLVSREADARSLSERLGCVVILKGAGTVVAQGDRVWVCARGHPCMGVGGTGDVLAGVIGGLIAQGMGAFDAARAGVEAHARAGEAWARERRASGGMLSRELADLVPGEIERLRKLGAG